MNPKSQLQRVPLKELNEELDPYSRREGKREACGIFGIYSKIGHPVSFRIYNGLSMLQHRGQDSAGIATSNGSKIFVKTGLGLVADIFDRKAIESLIGHVGIGHTRYPTIGGCTKEDAQPQIISSPKRGMALAHNGNIANYSEISSELAKSGRMISSGCDAEIILHLFALEYEKTHNFFSAARKCMEKLDGSYSAVLVSGEGDLVVFRDPYGIKPLCYGEDNEKMIFASESVALDINEVELSGYVQPGEVVVVNEHGISRKVVMPNKKPAHCMFEYVYFARPDSILESRLVYEVRVELGRRLAEVMPVDADAIVPVPDTARPAAIGYSERSGIPVVEGLLKNRYIGRTFIMPSQEKRNEAVRLKLNPVRHLIKDKEIIMIDDSIVRGTTCGPIVALLKKGGAKKVHVRITSPPIIAPCFYGIDLPTYSELIAANYNVAKIAKKIGADSLAYLPIDDLVSAIGLGDRLCLGCITDKYPTKTAEKLSKKLKAHGGKLKGCRIWEGE
ncbi:MAG: amidophosphoribosyltransferase [Candidatus Anstonellales archaeon]